MSTSTQSQEGYQKIGFIPKLQDENTEALARLIRVFANEVRAGDETALKNHRYYPAACRTFGASDLLPYLNTEPFYIIPILEKYFDHKAAYTTYDEAAEIWRCIIRIYEIT